MKKIPLPIVLVICSIFLFGCATQSTSQGMTVTSLNITKINEKFKSAIAVAEVKGGKETNPLWTSQVGNEEFKKALEKSLALTGYLAKPGSGKFTLTAELISLDQPVLGISFDVKSTVNYELKNEVETKLIPITAVGTGEFSDSWVGIERLRIANEKSIQKNISNFINALSNQ